jgi:hypothetical protein
MNLRPLAAVAIAATLAAAAPASAVTTIDFDAIPLAPFTPAPFTSVTEDGFTVTRDAGAAAINASNLFPPAPLSGIFLIGDPAFGSILNAVVDVASVTPGATFTFESIDLFNLTSSPQAPASTGFAVEGFLGGPSGTSVGAEAYSVSQATAGTYAATIAGLSGKTIDLLRIFFPTGQVATSGGGGYTVNTAIDNIRLGVIPLPAGAWLLLSGLGLAGLVRRRGRRPNSSTKAGHHGAAEAKGTL